MFKVALIAVLALTALAVNQQSPVWNSRDLKSLAQISTSHWGNFVLNFGELHLQSGGVLNELLQAVEDLLVDLQAELDEVHHVYSRRTDQHNREMTRLEQEIQDKEREVFNAHDFLDNVLVPQGERFAKQLEQLEENIDSNRQSLEEETFTRQQNKEDFEAKAAEHNEAIEAIDESLQLLSQLGQPSLVQIKKVQKNLNRIQASLKRHSMFQTMIRALLQVATESAFADQGALRNILEAFNQLRNQLVDSLNTATADEADAVSDFAERVAQLNKEFAEFTRAVVVKNAEIASNNQKTDDTYVLIDELEDDLDTLNGQLNAENDDFAQATDLYNSLVAEYTHELNCAQQANELLTQPRFTEYVNANIKGF